MQDHAAICEAVVNQNQPIRLRSYKRNYASWQYSPSITTVADALLLPQTVQTQDHELKAVFRNALMVFNGGVYDSGGGIVEPALHEGMLRHLPDADVPAVSPQRLHGNWLYGGVLFRHIGHMLTESVGRLWGLRDAGASCQGVVFIAMNGVLTDVRTSPADWVERSAETTARSTQFREMLELFGIDLPVHLVGSPVQVEQLQVPSQLMGLLPYGELLGGHPVYREHLRERVNRYCNIDGHGRARRIYVSRSRFLKPTSASIFGEASLDHYFREHGFEVMHPELLTLKQQIAHYASASHIVLAAGSAAHVVAMALNGRQDVVLLKRFPGQNDQFGPQLRAMGARSVTTLDALATRFLPVNQADRESFSEPRSAGTYGLDLDALWRRLAEMNFVAPTLQQTLRHELDAEVSLVAAQFAQRYGKPFDLLPIV